MRTLSIALLIPIATSCASKQSLPASPVPAVLTDMQAAKLADAYLADSSPAVGPRQVRFIQPTGDGHFVGYQTHFDPTGKPSKLSYLISVKHDGRIRELTFRKNQ